MKFDQNSLTILEEITSQEELYFKSNKTGNLIKGEPTDTMLYSIDKGEIHSSSLYKNILKTVSVDPTNPKIEYPGGCPKCKRLIVSYIRTGEDKRTFYQCFCKTSWSN